MASSTPCRYARSSAPPNPATPPPTSRWIVPSRRLVPSTPGGPPLHRHPRQRPPRQRQHTPPTTPPPRSRSWSAMAPRMPRLHLLRVARVGQEGGLGGAPGPVASKAPSWLRIGGKGARARAEANGGVPAWLTGKPRGHGRISSAKASPDDVRKVLARVGASADRGRTGQGAGCRAIVARLLAAGVPQRVFRASNVTMARASRWRRAHGQSDAVKSWTTAVLGRPVTMRSLVAAFLAYYGLTTKGRGKGKAKVERATVASATVGTAAQG